jgi:CheY-like chemotaxis protein
MTLQPEVPYSGSSFVAETLVWFSRAEGRRILVSTHPKLSNAAKTAGYFIGCGYQGELAQTCRAAMQFAVETPDTELIVVDLTTPEPSVAEFVQEIRNDPRTADIPIAVLSNNETVLESAPNFQYRSEMQKTDQLRPNAPFSVALSQTYPRVVNDDGAKWINNDLFSKTGVEPVSPAVRLEQARKSLNWIKTIVENSQSGQKIYHFEELEDTVFRALRSGGRIEAGLELAAVIKSGSMQSAIYETAANSLHPIELRRKAAELFKKSIENFGILLRGQQVQRLYDRYNASEFEPKETQELLGNLLDLIEK